ncbi:histidinol-phosphate transaminase [Lentibacillus halophilus]|uniref:Histidinol-phosphate aminotransferase n=1 Tax=Lentibacillus halophilus TaxID=295065 RepID=A0ABN0Z3L8_9BACI
MHKLWSDAAKRTEPYVPGEQLNDPDIIKLNTNESPYGPSPNVIEAIQKEVSHHLQLYPAPDAEALRDDIGRYYQLDKEHIFVGNGSDEVLAFSFMAFFNTDARIQFPSVTYSFYPVYAKLFHIPYEEVPLNQDFTIPVESFFQSDGGIIMANPNAPTGIYLSLENVETIAANNSDQVVIMDEAYIDFAPASAASLVQDYPNLLIVQTMSKSRSLAGLRIGFAIGQPHLIEALFRIKDSFNSYTMDRLALAGAAAAMKDDHYFQETTEEIIRTREWLIPEMKKRGFSVLPSAANFIFTTHSTVKAETLYNELKRRKILIRHFQNPAIANHVRITIGTEKQMEQLLRAIDAIIA